MCYNHLPDGLPYGGIPDLNENPSVDNSIDPSVLFNPYHETPEDDLTEQDINVENELNGQRIPMPPILPIIQRRYTARYRGRTGNYELELRVDIDGTNNMGKVSGDFFQFSGQTKTYWGSFILPNPVINFNANHVLIQGSHTSTSPLGAPIIRVRIPKTTIIQPTPNAVLTFLSAAGIPTVIYTCPYESRHLRSVKYDSDRVAAVTPFISYNTGALPSGGPSRNLSVVNAFAEAGIELIPTGGGNLVPTGAIGASWSNAELHAAMVSYLTGHTNSADWRVWMLEAVLHDNGPGLYGIMFDQMGAQRQGCAVFHQGIGGASAEKQRLQLYTLVHELGHCFNLFHSFHKIHMTPPMPNRPMALSWMNYPFIYPTGEPNYWSNFGFKFDTQELLHLRHAYRNNIIMGGNSFGSGAALEHSHNHADLNDFNAPIEDYTSLSLRIENRKTYFMGEPVVVDLRLSCSGSKEVNARLHPNFDMVKIAIIKPSGKVVIYEPLFEHLALPDLVTLNQDSNAIYESAYIGYGKNGFTFDESGSYTLKAFYIDMEGNKVVSNESKLRVKFPISEQEDDLAELFMGDEQGKLLYLLGSDSPSLQEGNEAFDTVLAKYREHPMSAYAALVKGVNAARDFKTIDGDKNIIQRESDVKSNEQLISHVIKLSKNVDQGVDNISLNMAICTMAKCQHKDGDNKKAQSTLDKMVKLFKERGLKAAVISNIENDASQLLKA